MIYFGMPFAKPLTTRTGTLMKSLKKFGLILLLPLMAFTTAHKFYVSVTNIAHSEKDQALQITTRLFTDDMDALLKERYDLEAALGTKKESPLADAYLEKYIRAKFGLEINGKPHSFKFLGKRFDTDVMVCYLEVPGISLDTLQSVQVQNEVLTDLFEDQQNLVHIRIKDIKKSFVLVRENNKGMLNL